MQKIHYRKLIIYLGLTVFLLAQSACVQSYDALTRERQEEAFRDVFGFKPPPTVSDIKYHTLYNRHLLDDVYGEWLRFTYDEDVFDSIIENDKFRRVSEGGLDHSSLLMDKFVDWWPEMGAQSNIALYTAEIKKPGFSAHVFIWHDETSGWVYWHRRWGD